MATRFSANLGFLWAELPLADAIRAAKAAGFDAVECHWPYGEPLEQVNMALAETGLPMLGLNTSRGDATAGENGLSALVGREAEARAAIDQAVSYGAQIGARHVHVMAGNASGEAAHRCFVKALRYACDVAAHAGMRVLIEPLNASDAPGYFLRTTGQAVGIIDEVAAHNLALMFDCYHVAHTEGDVLAQLATVMPQVGHIQFAGVPDRGTPLSGELDYATVFRHIARLGFAEPLGAEYRPEGKTEDTLEWMAALR